MLDPAHKSLLKKRKQKTTKKKICEDFVVGLHGKGGRATSVRSCQNLPPCLTEPMQPTHHWPRLSPSAMVVAPLG